MAKGHTWFCPHGAQCTNPPTASKSAFYENRRIDRRQSCTLRKRRQLIQSRRALLYAARTLTPPSANADALIPHQGLTMLLLQCVDSKNRMALWSYRAVLESGRLVRMEVGPTFCEASTTTSFSKIDRGGVRHQARHNSRQRAHKIAATNADRKE